jgi:hypothetical protein
MTTMTFNAAGSQSFFAMPRAPKLSFAARLAALQARHEAMPELGGFIRFAACGALALVPFTALAWVFVTI